MHTAARCSAREERKREVSHNSSNAAINKNGNNASSSNRKHRRNANKRMLGDNTYAKKEYAKNEGKNTVGNARQGQSEATEPKAAYTKELWEVPKNMLHTNDSDENERLFAFNFDDYLISEQDMSIDCDTLNDAQFNLWDPIDEVLNISREWELEQDEVCINENKSKQSIPSIKRTNIITTTNEKMKHKTSTIATNTMQKHIHNSRKRPITSMPTTAKTSPMQKLAVCNTFTSERYSDKDDAWHNNTNMYSVSYNESSCDVNSTNTTVTLQALKDKISNAHRRLHHLRKKEVNVPLYKENKLSRQYFTCDNDEITQSTCAVSSSSSSPMESSSEELERSSEKTNMSNHYNNESKKDKIKNWKRICKHDITKDLDNDWFMMLGIEKDFQETHERTGKGKKSKGNWEEEFDIDRYAMQLLCDESSVDTDMHHKVKNTIDKREVESENKTWCDQNNTNKSEENATNNTKLCNKSNHDEKSDDVIISEIVAKYAKVLNKEIESLSSFTLECEVETNWPMLMNSATLLCGYSATEINELLKCSVDYINKIAEENGRHTNVRDEQSTHAQMTSMSCNVTDIDNKQHKKRVEKQKKLEEELYLEEQGLPKRGTNSSVQDNKTRDNEMESEKFNKLLYELKEARDVHVQEALVDKLLDHLPTVPDELSTELSRQRRLIEHLIEVQRESMRRVKNAEKSVSIMNAKLFPSSVSHVDKTTLWNNNNNKEKESVVADALYTELIEEKNEHADNIDRHDNINNNSCSESDLPNAHTMNHTVKMRNGQPLPITLHTSANSNTHSTLSNEVMLLSAEQQEQERERQKLTAQREEAEARYYLKELYRVSDDYKSMLEDEKEKRRAERRAFGELLNHQQTQLLAQHKQELRELLKERRMQKIENDLLVQKLLHATQDKVEKVVSDSALQNRTEMGLMMKGAVDKIESHLTKSALTSLRQRAEGSPYKRTPQRKVQLPSQQTKSHERTAAQNASVQKKEKYLHSDDDVDDDDDVSKINNNSIPEKEQIGTKSASTKDKAKENVRSINDAIIEEEKEEQEKHLIDEIQIDKEHQEKETKRPQSIKQINRGRQTHEMQIAKLKSVYIAPQSRKNKLHLTNVQKDKKTLHAKEKEEILEEQLEKEMKEVMNDKLRINIQPHEPTMHFTSQETMTLDADGEINSFNRNVVSEDMRKTPETEQNIEEELEREELLQQNNITHTKECEVVQKLCNNFANDERSDVGIRKKGQVNAFIGQTVLLVTPRTTRHMTDKYNEAQTELVRKEEEEQEEERNINDVCSSSSNSNNNITSYQSQWQMYTQIVIKIKELLHDIHREEAALDSQSAQNVHCTNAIRYNAEEKENNDNNDDNERFMAEMIRMTTSNNVNDNFKKFTCTKQKTNNRHLLQKGCHESKVETEEDKKNLESKLYKLEKTFSKVLEIKREELNQARCELQEIQNAMLHKTSGINLQTSTIQANYKHNFLINHSGFAARDKDADELIGNIKSELVHTVVEDAKVKEMTCTIMECIKQELINKCLEMIINNNEDNTVKDAKSFAVTSNREHSEKHFNMDSMVSSVHDQITVETGVEKESLIEELVAHSLSDLVLRILDQEKMYNIKGVKVDKNIYFSRSDCNETAKNKEEIELHEEKQLEEHLKKNAEQELHGQTNTTNEQKANNNANAIVHKTASDIFARIDQLHSDDANTWETKTHDEVHINHTLSNDNSFLIIPGKKMLVDDIYENVASESFKPLRPAWIHDTATDDENNNAISNNNNNNNDSNRNKVIKSKYAVYDRYEDKPCMLSHQLYFPSSGSDTNPITVQLIKHHSKIKALTANVKNKHTYEWWQEYNRRPQVQSSLSEQQQQKEKRKQQQEEEYLQEQSNIKELKSHTNKVNNRTEEYKFAKNDKEEREREREEELYDNDNYYKHAYRYAPMPPLQIFIDVGKFVNQEWSTSLSGLPLAAQKLDLEDEVQSHQLLIEGGVRNNTLQNESRRCICNDADETLDDVIVEKIEEVFEPNVVERNIPVLITTTPQSNSTKTIKQQQQEKVNSQLADKKIETLHKAEQCANNDDTSECILNKHREQQQAVQTKSQTEVITMEKEIQQCEEEQHHHKEQLPLMLSTQNWEKINYEEVQSRFVLDEIAELEYNNLLSTHEMTVMSSSTLPKVPERLDEEEQYAKNNYQSREQQQAAGQLWENYQHLTQEERIRYEENQNSKKHEKPATTNSHDTKTCKSSTQMTILPPRDPILHFVFQWLKEAGETETNKQFNRNNVYEKEGDQKTQTNEVNGTSQNINQESSTVINERTQNQEHDRLFNNKNNTPTHPILAGLRRANRLANTFETPSDESELPIVHESTITESLSSSLTTALEESSYESLSQSMPGLNTIHGKEKKMFYSCATTTNNNKQGNINAGVHSSQSFEEELNEVQYNKLFPTLTSASTEITSTCVSTPFYKQNKNKYNTFAKNNKCKFNATSRKSRAAPVISLSSTEKVTSYDNETDLITTSDSDKKWNRKENENESQMSSSVSLMLKRSESSNTTRYTSTSRSLSVPDELYFSNTSSSRSNSNNDNVCIGTNMKGNIFETYSYLGIGDTSRNNDEIYDSYDDTTSYNSNTHYTSTTRATTESACYNDSGSEWHYHNATNKHHARNLHTLPTTLISPALNDHDDGDDNDDLDNNNKRDNCNNVNVDSKDGSTTKIDNASVLMPQTSKTNTQITSQQPSLPQETISSR